MTLSYFCNFFCHNFSAYIFIYKFFYTAIRLSVFGIKFVGGIKYV